MKIALCSAFRDAENYLDRYFAQASLLAVMVMERGHDLTLVLGYGDSDDDTQKVLESLAFQDEDGLLHFDLRLVESNHGGPHFGSIVHPQRFRQLATVWNAIWARIPDDAEAVIFCESDLIWRAETMMALLDNLQLVPAVAPMVAEPRHSAMWPSFYDVWAFRRAGVHFTKYPPYFPVMSHAWAHRVNDELERVDSAGSCLALRGALARQVRWPEADVVVGVCRQIYELGGDVWVNRGLEVQHP